MVASFLRNESFAFHIEPSVLIEGNSSFLKLISKALSFSGICLITATEFDIHFLAYNQLFPKILINLDGFGALLVESMVSSMCVEQRAVSSCSGSSGFFLFGIFLTHKLRIEQ